MALAPDDKGEDQNHQGGGHGFEVVVGKQISDGNRFYHCEQEDIRAVFRFFLLLELEGKSMGEYQV